MEPSDIVERLDQVANDIVDALGTLIGGPYSTRDDAVRYVTDHLRATYVAEITRLRAALAQRTEECARVAEGIGEKHLQWSKMSLPVEPSPIIAKDRADVAKRIAAAIRTRGS